MYYIIIIRDKKINGKWGLEINPIKRKYLVINYYDQNIDV